MFKHEVLKHLEAIKGKLLHLHEMAHAFEERLGHLHGMAHANSRKLDAIFELLTRINPGKAVDLSIVFGSATPTTAKGNEMANKKATGAAVKCPCLAAKAGPKKAVMPDITLTDPLPKSITLQPLDKDGNVVTLTPSDTVAGTLSSSDSAVLAVAAGADTLNYVGTIPANTPQGSTADLAATLKGTIQGAAADLSASVHVTINVPPATVAVDLAIVFGA